MKNIFRFLIGLLVGLAIVFFWHVLKNQPKHNKKISYSIKQGKEIK